MQQMTRAVRRLFDHLVGGDDERLRNGEADRPGGLMIDDQLELGRLHDRQVRELGTSLDNAAGIVVGLAPRIRNVLRSSSGHRLRHFRVKEMPWGSSVAPPAWQWKK